MFEQSPELETLDQLLCGDMSLDIVRPLYRDDEHFSLAISRMLEDGAILLLHMDGSEVPRWEARRILMDPATWSRESGYVLSLTKGGAQRVS